MDQNLRVVAVLCCATTFCSPAFAETKNCADRQKITERLESGYGEKFAGGGLRNSESIFEVWMSDDSGTWTILMTKPSGQSCVLAAGTDWRSSPSGQRETVIIPKQDRFSGIELQGADQGLDGVQQLRRNWPPVPPEETVTVTVTNPLDV